MGLMTAMALAESSDRETALELHLRGNHYPPLPVELVPTCLKAIEAIEEGDYDRLVPLELGTWKGFEDRKVDGKPAAPAHGVANAFHLDAFINDTEVT